MPTTVSGLGYPRQTSNLWIALGRLACALVMIGGSLVPLAAFANDALYRDPRQPSFSLLVPDGWTAEKNSTGVTIRRGGSWAQVAVKPGMAEPAAVLVQIRPQIERQSRNFRELETGAMTLSGYKGAYVIYSAIPPSGVSEIAKLVTLTTGQMTYLVSAAARSEEYRSVKGDLDRILASFTPDRGK